MKYTNRIHKGGRKMEKIEAIADAYEYVSKNFKTNINNMFRKILKLILIT